MVSSDKWRRSPVAIRLTVRVVKRVNDGETGGDSRHPSLTVDAVESEGYDADYLVWFGL